MKKRSIALWVSVFLILSVGVLLNVNVSIRQGINYEVRILRMPLYLKLIDFYDRHLNYKRLVTEISGSSGKMNDEDKALAVFNWVIENISKQPEGLPVIDDHVWHIIVRRYGADDQFQDVFATLCNYAGLKAFFDQLSTAEGAKKSLSFVSLNNKWVIFDVFHGVYFKNPKGGIADVDDLISGVWQEVSLKDPVAEDYYREYFKSLRFVNYSQSKYSRSTIQSPLKRFIFWLKDKKPH